MVVPPRDGEALAAAIGRLMEPALRERMATAARAAVLPFNSAAMTLKAVLLYRDLLAATVPARGQAADLPARSR
jgi:hypothetical protein